ncbi:unnamed protein product [Gongylonema pulchrum]|uniref:Protein AAR2 homolog n=1 Tax=Gongylonema pulchrum TaxID=637853 RepID=A0A183EA49_9BILA|nr:unnamed protein product [Gongylonema pulchrum]
MIPPGVHFIFFSVKGAPRIGFFHYFKESEVLLRKWEPSREDMVVEVTSTDEVAKVRSNLKSMDGEKTVQRLRPENQYGRITSQAELVTMETELMEREKKTVQRLRPENQYGRITSQAELVTMETEMMERESAVANTGRSSVDRTWQLDELLNTVDGQWSEVLGELQFAFVCFLMGQELYLALLPVLHFQLKECPEDFFVDIVSRDNFLTTTLAYLFGSIADCKEATSALKEKSKKFKNFLTKRFKWNFDVSDE